MATKNQQGKTKKKGYTKKEPIRFGAGGYVPSYRHGGPHSIMDGWTEEEARAHAVKQATMPRPVASHRYVGGWESPEVQPLTPEQLKEAIKKDPYAASKIGGMTNPVVREAAKNPEFQGLRESYPVENVLAMTALPVIRPFQATGALAKVGNIGAELLQPGVFSPGKGLMAGIKQLPDRLGSSVGHAIGAYGRTMSGLKKGYHDIKKGRKFSETFPITKAQRAEARRRAENARKAADHFLGEWYAHPTTRAKMLDLIEETQNARNVARPMRFDAYLSRESQADNIAFPIRDFNKTLKDPDNTYWAYGDQIHRFTKAKRAGVDLPNLSQLVNPERASDLARLAPMNRRYVTGNTGFLGVNTGAQSITLRKMGLYNPRPSSLFSTMVHEGGHSLQNARKLPAGMTTDPIGRQLLLHETNPTWGDAIIKWDKNLSRYAIPATETYTGKLIAKHMVPWDVKPKQSALSKKLFGEKLPYVWPGSPGELHSELMAARGKIWLRGKDAAHKKRLIESLRNPSNGMIDQLIKDGNLNRFFKAGTPIEIKRQIIRALPAVGGVGAIGGAASQSQTAPQSYEDGGSVGPKPIYSGASADSLKLYNESKAAFNREIDDKLDRDFQRYNEIMSSEFLTDEDKKEIKKPTRDSYYTYDSYLDRDNMDRYPDFGAWARARAKVTGLDIFQGADYPLSENKVLKKPYYITQYDTYYDREPQDLSKRYSYDRPVYPENYNLQHFVANRNNPIQPLVGRTSEGGLDAVFYAKPVGTVRQNIDKISPRNPLQNSFNNDIVKDSPYAARVSVPGGHSGQTMAVKDFIDRYGKKVFEKNYPNLVGKYEDGGGVEPYVTNNPNDPRLQAYRDSSFMHRWGEGNYRYMRDVIEPRIEQDYARGGTMDRAREMWADFRDERELKDTKTLEELKRIYPKNKPVETYSPEGLEEHFGVYRWKKPTQEVILKERQNVNKIPTRGLPQSTFDNSIDSSPPYIRGPYDNMMYKGDYHPKIWNRMTNKYEHGGTVMNDNLTPINIERDEMIEYTDPKTGKPAKVKYDNPKMNLHGKGKETIVMAQPGSTVYSRKDTKYLDMRKHEKLAKDTLRRNHANRKPEYLDLKSGQRVVQAKYGCRVPSFGFGGDLLKGIGDIGVMAADNAASAVGFQDVVPDSAYSDTGFGQGVKKASKITNQIHDVAGTAVLGAFTGGAGIAAKQALKSSLGQAKFMNQNRFEQPDEDMATYDAIGAGIGQMGNYATMAFGSPNASGVTPTFAQGGPVLGSYGPGGWVDLSRQGNYAVQAYPSETPMVRNIPGMTNALIDMRGLNNQEKAGISSGLNDRRKGRASDFQDELHFDYGVPADRARELMHLYNTPTKPIPVDSYAQGGPVTRQRAVVSSYAKTGRVFDSQMGNTLQTLNNQLNPLGFLDLFGNSKKGAYYAQDEPFVMGNPQEFDDMRTDAYFPQEPMQNRYLASHTNGVPEYNYGTRVGATNEQKRTRTPNDAITMLPKGVYAGATALNLMGPISDLIYSSKGYDKVNYRPIGAPKMDPSQLISDIKHQSAATRYSIPRLSGSGRSVMNSMLGLNMQTNRSIAGVRQQYDNANEQLRQRTDMFNAQRGDLQQQHNLASKARRDDIRRKAISDIPGALAQGMNDYHKAYYDDLMYKLFKQRYGNILEGNT